MKAMGNGEAFTIAFDAGEATVSSNDAISISVIVMEAISNAIKYAPLGTTPLAINVSLVAGGGSPVTVTVEDDGLGFDDEVTHGLGSAVIAALASSLRARLIHEHVNPQAERRGARVILDFRPAGDMPDTEK
jgi:two-component sensor histidine kinase